MENDQSTRREVERGNREGNGESSTRRDRYGEMGRIVLASIALGGAVYIHATGGENGGSSEEYIPFASQQIVRMATPVVEEPTEFTVPPID